jgi:hypothetical protein
VNLGGLKCLFETKRRQDGRNALRQHGLARAGRADRQDVMATGAGNFEGALGGVLSANVFEIDGIVLRLAEKRVTVNLERQDAVAGVHEADDIEVDDTRPSGNER